MQSVVDLLSAELERPRALPGQVARHLNATYGVSRDAVGEFLDRELEGLEDYEIDLILSPVFTPTLNDQALFAPALGGQGLAPADIAALVQQLVARGTVTPLVTDDGQTHRLRLREVSIARYVERLRLDGAIPEDLLGLILKDVPEGERGIVLAVARRAVWTLPSRTNLLNDYLQRATASADFRSEDLLTLLRLVETYEPRDLPEFQSRLPGWIEAVRQEGAAAAQPKPFFNERVEDMHGGGRDQRRGADPRAAAREAEWKSLQRLAGSLSA